MQEYDSWRQLAGYFDGDGTIAISDKSNRPYKLSLSLIFVDQSPDQIRTVKKFLNNRGIATSNILKTSKGTANMVAVSRFNAVKKALRSMLPFLCKKSVEAQAALDYYEGRISGNRLVAIFQEEVENLRRERRERKVTIDVPFTHQEGDKMMKALRNDKLRDALGRYRSKVTLDDYRLIREEFFNRGVSVPNLVKRYRRYSRETIRRILGKGRGYVLVKGKGLVRATDTT